MNVQFDWQAGDENGAWESIAVTKGLTRRRISWRTWSLLTAALITVAVGGYALLLRRYNTALSRITFQIQGVIDLEARALAQRDVDLYLAQQDTTSPAWLAGQAAHIRAHESQSNSGPPGARAWATVPGDRSSVKVQEVELWQDIAWVQVVTGQDPVRQVRFYRRTDLGWKHTAPRIAFWGAPVELAYGDVMVRGHERDLPQVEPLIEHISHVYEGVCTTLGCPPDSALRIDIAVEVGTDTLPTFRKNTLTLASPWLSGIPLKGTWDEATLDELAYLSAYAAAWQVIRPAPKALHLLQRAILVEYATLYAHQDATQAPILRRIVERHGVGVLPDVLADLEGPVPTSRFVARWLSTSPSEEDAYFDNLADITREAALAEQDEAAYFVNLLLYENAAPWVEWTEYCDF